MLRKPLIVLSVATLIGCGGGDGGSGPAPIPLSLSAVTDTVRPGGVLLVRVSGGRVTQDSLGATLGGVATALGRLDDTTLVLLAPDVPPGARALRVEIGGDTVQTTVSLLAALQFADPEAAIAEALDAPLAAAPAFAPVGITQADWAVRRARADSLVEQAKAEVASLSAADQLMLARMLASVALPDAGPAAAPALRLAGEGSANLFGDGACDVAKRAFVRSGMASLYSIGSLVFFIMKPPVIPALKAAGVLVSAAATAGTMLVTHGNFLQVGIDCVVLKTVDATRTPLAEGMRLTTAGVPAAQTAGAQRFFQGRGVTYYPQGLVGPLSSAEIAKDAVIAEMAALLDDLHFAVQRLQGLLPDALARKIPALPRLSTMLPGPTTLEPLTAGDVRIENVSPASVQLTKSGSGEAIVLTMGATVTDDVPFTYTLVSTADPTIRRTMSGVARPYMSATILPIPATVAGTKTITTDANGNQTGTLTCGGTATVRVKGGDTAMWESFNWSYSGVVSESKAEPIRGAGGARVEFESGDHAFGGSWYSWGSENGAAVFHPFTVSVTVTYTDLLTGAGKTAGPVSFTCTA